MSEASQEPKGLKRLAEEILMNPKVKSRKIERKYTFIVRMC